MKTVMHKSCVETELICSEDGKNTYEVIKRLKGVDGDTGIIVMLFPTKNGNNICSDDNTTNFLLSHMKDLGLNEIRIINLFSKVSNSRISSRGLQVDTQNMDFIENEVFANKDLSKQKFIVAWGNSMESSKAVNESKRLIIDMYLKKLPKGKITQIVCPERGLVDGANHILFLGIRAKTARWRLMEYNSDKILAANIPIDKISKKPSVSSLPTVKLK